ncbi:hypothetical protein V8D89_011449 [Ganoderma adspersum]
MPLSVGGGQLPLSAFFGSESSGPSGKRAAKPKLSSKRKGSPVRQKTTEPARKKRKHKENLTPSGDQNLENGTHNLESAPGTSKPRRRQSSSTEMEVEELDALLDLADGVGVNMSPRDALIGPSVDGSDGIIDITAPKHPHNLDTHTLTPEALDRRQDFASITSLPSPPLTAPDAKRGRKKHDDEDKREDILVLPQVTSIDQGNRIGPVDVKNIDKHPSSSSPSQAHTVGHNAPCSPRSSQSGRDLMPPPPLPLKVLLSSSDPQSAALSMPRPALSRRPRSISSEKWVPSSQTQELSIPRYEDMQDDQPANEVPLGRRRRVSQVIPSSQLCEKELEVLHSSPARIFSSSPVLVDRPGELVSTSTPATSAMDGGPEGPITHEIVQSSQSQFETEITAAWAETLAVRREALRWPKKTSPSLPSSSSSSPPRAVETQDYDAESEWSPSIDEVSQSLTMDPRTSPLQPASQLPSAGPSSSYVGSHSVSHSVLPSQMHQFLETFEGRDDNGNELPRDVGVGPVRSCPSSPRYDRGRSPRQRRREMSLVSSESQRERWDAITASPPAIPRDYVSDGGSSYGSSFPSTMPTPLRNFLEMFPDTQTQVEPSQRRDDDIYDL